MRYTFGIKLIFECTLLSILLFCNSRSPSSDSHPNRRASVRVSISQPQLGYPTSSNGSGSVSGSGGGGGSGSGGGGGNGSAAATASCTTPGGNGSGMMNIATIQGQSLGLNQSQRAGSNYQLEQVRPMASKPDERQRHKMRPFKFALNRVATPTLNLR